MRKQELIHLHGLFAEVTLYFEHREDATLSLQEYRSLNVNPRSLHHSKEEHKTAVFELVDAIEGEIVTETKEPVVARSQS